MMKPELDRIQCGCGCGQYIEPKKHHKRNPVKYIRGHSGKGKTFRVNKIPSNEIKNRYEHREGYTVVFLDKKDGSVLETKIDTEDLDKLRGYKWSDSTRYVIATKQINGHHSPRTTFRLHRVVMDCPENMEVDHINGDTLDNRKSNLRICTRHQNLLNTSKHNKKNYTKFKGVYKHSGKWQSSIQFNKKNYYIGFFDSEIEAARAYNKKAEELFGEFARLNDVEGELARFKNAISLVISDLETKLEQMKRTPLESELSIKFRAGYVEALKYAIERVKEIE